MEQKLYIDGMSCGHCAQHVTAALKEVVGVTFVNVDLEEKNALIKLAYAVDAAKLGEAVHEAGYELVRIEEVTK